MLSSQRRHDAAEGNRRSSAIPVGCTDRRDAFVELLFRESRQAGSALVFVSHDAGLAPMFDRTVELPDINRVCATGE